MTTIFVSRMEVKANIASNTAEWTREEAFQFDPPLPLNENVVLDQETMAAAVRAGATYRAYDREIETEEDET